MNIQVRAATRDDLDELCRLYRLLEAEMVALHPMWSLADGLPEPIELALGDALEDPDSVVVVGGIDQSLFGFLLARVEDLLPQAGGERLGAIRLVFVEPEAREVGIGEHMRDLALESLRSRGITKFDAHVLPGHRVVKNFFEAGGFSARSIVMHRDDRNPDRGRRPTPDLR
jgi:ribosomal protein S18 acetylase RimI-like enzyme